MHQAWKRVQEGSEGSPPSRHHSPIGASAWIPVEKAPLPSLAGLWAALGLCPPLSFPRGT